MNRRTNGYLAFLELLFGRALGIYWILIKITQKHWLNNEYMLNICSVLILLILLTFYRQTTTLSATQYSIVFTGEYNWYTALNTLYLVKFCKILNKISEGLIDFSVSLSPLGTNLGFELGCTGLGLGLGGF